MSQRPTTEAEEVLEEWLLDELERRRNAPLIPSHRALNASSEAWRLGKVLEVQIVADDGEFCSADGAVVGDLRMGRRLINEGEHHFIVQGQLGTHTYWEGFCYAKSSRIRHHCWLTTVAGEVIDVDPIAEAPLAYKGISFSNKFTADYRDASSRYLQDVPGIKAGSAGAAILCFFYNVAAGSLRESLTRVVGDSVTADYEREVCSRFPDIFRDHS